MHPQSIPCCTRLNQHLIHDETVSTLLHWSAGQLACTVHNLDYDTTAEEVFFVLFSFIVLQLINFRRHGKRKSCDNRSAHTYQIVSSIEIINCRKNIQYNKVKTPWLASIHQYLKKIYFDSILMHAVAVNPLSTLQECLYF